MEVSGHVGQVVVGTVVHLQCGGRPDCSACRLRRHIGADTRHRQMGRFRGWPRSSDKR
jgi:hypothetical protein